MDADGREGLIASLRGAAPFHGLAERELEAVADAGTVEDRPAGAIVFEQGEPSDALYVVERGSVVVSKHVHNEVDIVLTRFQPGDFFGEMGLFDEAPRSATAQADVESHLWMLKRAAFNEILTKHTEIAAKICYRMVGVFIHRLRATNEQAREAVRWGLEATGYSPIGDPALLGRKST